MTNYKRGDIVLIDFGFSEGTGSKKRPVMIISSELYHRSRHEVVVLAITSNIERILFGDTKIIRWKEAGLLFPSLVTGIMRTIKDTLIIRKLGTISTPDFHKVVENLKKTLNL